MTEVAFHFNVPDKFDYTCRLLRKAHGAGSKVVVTGEEAFLARLDHQLWSFSNFEFMPHCTRAASEQVRAQTPIFLTPALEGCPHHEVLVNVRDEVVAGFELFGRVIEVVSNAPDDRAAGRVRWKQYVEAGLELKRHDVAR